MDSASFRREFGRGGAKGLSGGPFRGDGLGVDRASLRRESGLDRTEGLFRGEGLGLDRASLGRESGLGGSKDVGFGWG